MGKLLRFSTLILATLLLTASPVFAAEQQYPDVIEVVIIPTGTSYTFNVTLSSPYDSASRYADAFRVMSANGEVYGVRELLHDHAYEQPFTRALRQVEIPQGVAEVIVEGRDQKYGWGGKTVTISLP
ncbi:hypothetical protein [Reinekea marinisedimentorum]|uniref:Uncharacterized protein n=1 Tax=Reinekea marinisedimentorum TaxID=230495 RepID=A0A4R3ID41_9GAMM|nr:hypothetical protein [Reinekea marinisedimentorum]TCS43676.1 hypothetical protein BCF53_10118 [Reinekea marinisedimentorum]